MILIKIIVVTTIVAILAILIATEEERGCGDNKYNLKTSILIGILKKALEMLICFFLPSIGIYINKNIISVLLELLLMYIRFKK